MTTVASSAAEMVDRSVTRSVEKKVDSMAVASAGYSEYYLAVSKVDWMAVKMA